VALSPLVGARAVHIRHHGTMLIDMPMKGYHKRHHLFRLALEGRK
jgi:hypothetical protein